MSLLDRDEVPGAEVPRLDQADGQAAGGRVQGHPGADHAAADDQHLMLGRAPSAASAAARSVGPSLAVSPAPSTSPVRALTRRTLASGRSAARAAALGVTTTSTRWNSFRSE